MRVGGTEITLDPSWLLIFVVVGWLTSASIIPVRLLDAAIDAGLQQPSPQPQPSYWVGGIAASVVFFASIVAHEAAHALVAIRVGISVPRIRLFVFGGVAEITQEPRAPREEFSITIAGPLMSAILGGGFLALAQLLPPVTVPHVTAQWLGEVNLLLAAFNLLPGFPLDGGRILRSIIWGITGNVHQATRVASSAGSAFAALLILFGVVSFVAFRVSPVQSLWTVFIGWFLWAAARTAHREAVRRERLSTMTVRDMTRPFTLAPFAHNSTVADVESKVLGQPAPGAWPVTDAGGEVFAMVTTRDVAAVPPFLRANISIATIMSELEADDVLTPTTPLTHVLDDAKRRQRGYYFVSAGGRITGWVFVGDLLQGPRLE